jgi:two-component system response regulator RegX3
MNAANATPTVLVVEDEESFVDALLIGLKKEGFRVEVARDGLEALDMFDIRKRSQVPIIMVTAKAAEIDTVVGLEVGADDYITKPYRLRELVARMRAVLRRAPLDRSSELTVGALQVGDIGLDPDQHEVLIRGVKTSLPLKEFELLHLLLANAGRVLPRETLIDRVWGNDYVGDTKTLDVHIKRLRAKIEADPANPEKIITIRGLGYKYERSRI